MHHVALFEIQSQNTIWHPGAAATVNSFSIDQTESVHPAFAAGVGLIVEWFRQKLYQAKYNPSMADFATAWLAFGPQS